jgi:hypothetical protein
MRTLRTIILLIIALAYAPLNHSSAISAQPERDRVAFAQYATAQTGSYQRWLEGNGLSRIITAGSLTATPPTLIADPKQTFLLHLTLNGAANASQDVAHTSWVTFRYQLLEAQHADIEQRLLFKLAHQLDVSANRVAIKLSRSPSDTCWVITLGITAEGYEADEHTCVSVTATANHPEAIPPLVTYVKDRTAAARRVVTIPFSETTAITSTSISSYTEVPSGIATGHVTPTLDAIESRLRQHYAHARYRRTTIAGGLREATIDEVRNEVLTDRWERIKVSLVAVPQPTGAVQIILIVDGQYAPGVGAHPPALESYRDMEPQYASALTTYTQALLTTLTAATP